MTLPATILFVTDIFATKGVEYLIAIAFLALLIPFWRLLTTRAPVKTPIPAGAHWLELPTGFFLHPAHAWSARRGWRTVRSTLLGIPDAIELPEVGTVLRRDGPSARLRFGQTTIPLRSPASGRVVAVNPAAAHQPGLLVRDPFGAGWLFEVAAANSPTAEHGLLSGDRARGWLRDAAEAMRARWSTGPLGLVYQDGGLPIPGALRHLEPDGWERTAEVLLGARPASDDEAAAA